MHRQLVAVLDRAPDLVDVAEVDLRVDALGEQVQAQRHQADVAGALAVAEQAALDPVGAGQAAQLGRGDRGAAVVVRVQRQHHRVAVRQVAVHPLDRVGVDVRRGHLDGGRQVDDALAVRRRLPHVVDRVADLDRELQLGAGVGLGRVLEQDDVRCRARASPPACGTAARPAPRCRRCLPSVSPKTTRRCSVDVELYRCTIACLAPRIDSKVRSISVVAGLGEHLDDDVVRDQVFLDQLPDEVEVGLAGRREADLDLLVAHPHQQLEHPPLAAGAHRVDQGLVAVAQVDRAPARRLGRDPGRPGAVVQADRGERWVAVDRHARRLLRVAGVIRGCGHQGHSRVSLGRPGQTGTPRRGDRPLGECLAAAAEKEQAEPHVCERTPVGTGASASPAYPVRILDRRQIAGVGHRRGPRWAAWALTGNGSSGSTSPTTRRC